MFDMKKVKVIYHSKFRVGEVDQRIFGGFIEHLGRCVYGGLYEPESGLSDENGYRFDVINALKELDFTAMRYPGGNFVSGYHWQDGVGPKDSRPVRYDPAWHSLEPNSFGTDEYMDVCRIAGWLPMITVNLGTGSPDEARAWLEYCNFGGETEYSKMRVCNGKAEPYGVKLWCLGNEMDGSWQLGHVPAKDYAIRAQQAAKMMKDTDGDIELVVCGSCASCMPTYMEWDYEVLSYIGDYADYVSLHRYAGNVDGDSSNYLAVTNEIDQQIEDMDALCRAISAKLKTGKRLYLCFDEWNVWYREKEFDGKGQTGPHLLEDVYNLEDALVVAGFLNSFIRHSDVVKIANMAQMVNVIAPILTNSNGLLRQSIYYAFRMYAGRRDGVSLRPVYEGDFYDAQSGRTSYVDTSAIINGNRLNVFLVNRRLDGGTEVEVSIADMDIASVESAEVLTGPGLKAFNSFAEPEVVVSREFDGVSVDNGRAMVKMPEASFAAISFKLCF
jgi:alpha-N-arabinofuranosidase